MLDRVDSFPYFASPFFLTIGVTKQALFVFLSNNAHGRFPACAIDKTDNR